MNNLCYKFTDRYGVEQILKNRTLLFKRADKFDGDKHELKLLNKLSSQYVKNDEFIDIDKLLKVAKDMISPKHDENYRNELSRKLNSVNNIQKFKIKPKDIFIFSTCDNKNNLKMWRENPYRHLDAVNYPWLQKDMEYFYEQEHRFVIPHSAIKSPIVDRVDDELFVSYGDSLKKVFFAPMPKNRFADCEKNVVKLRSSNISEPEIEVAMHTFKENSEKELSKQSDMEMKV